MEFEAIQLIKRFMLKNHIEHLDEDGYNDVIYTELDDDEKELTLDLTPIHDKLLEYGEGFLKGVEWARGAEVQHIKYFFVDMDSEELGMEIQWRDGDTTRMAIA